ncbi:bifunctional glutamate N-acetyltransferase/amino-acid acetyltransferase ArgJ [Alicyclobacillus shizuokensis]|uniref:bifunctional glutamate N-acetyltransferase/amino-acid acetyltransferase ArgJ n=1 Tax=Alicyclobacillus shizuokensis TaxID=392014 RepID=UPI0008361808|nr:bifunctional glutamate N-acetyltransferase/amino-acid acetyltransferase ArgJ [Alicyclobacillus shizuokensis]
MEWIHGGVTAPQGFLAAAARAGVKASGADDLAVVLSEADASAAGVFTTNVVQAAPVHWSRSIVHRRGRARAVLLNSGNANACTGRQGDADVRAMAATAARLLSIQPEDVLVASTGVIGVPLPMDLVLDGMGRLGAALARGPAADARAADAIRTTDTVMKQAAIRFPLRGRVVTIGGMAKGSGMIHPNMATMLAVLTTDAEVAPDVLQTALADGVDASFNMLSIDGDTSTNDSVFVLANGASGVEIARESDAYAQFSRALTAVMVSLAKQIARDGEGATKLLEVKVVGAQDTEAARRLAKSVVSSNLVKSAMFGRDANWGRVLAALGYSGVQFDPQRVRVDFVSPYGQILLLENGEPVSFSETEARRVLSADEVQVCVALNAGDGMAVAWGCDLTYDYVRINADYRT